MYDEATGLHTPVSAGAWHAIDGKQPHHVLPFCRERVAVVAYTHRQRSLQWHTPFGDSLASQGFPLPGDFGKTKVYPKSPDATAAALHRAPAAYESHCDEVMHLATSLTLADAADGGIAGDRSRSWTGLARLLILCLSSLLAGSRDLHRLRLNTVMIMVTRMTTLSLALLSLFAMDAILSIQRMGCGK